MSVFTNPAGRSIDNAREYVRAVLGLLGDRDPFEVLRATPAALLRTLDERTPEQIRTPEAPGKWAVRDVIQHLADSDLVWGYRVRLVLAQDRPPLTGYDQDSWANSLGYAESDPREAFDAFRVLRRANLRLVERASPDDLRRVGVHAERGDESLEHMIRLYAGHDILHLRQVERILEAV
jgi:DinB family protein